MKATVTVLMAALIVCTLAGCCAAPIRVNRCIAYRPALQCFRDQIRQPAEWCWGNCPTPSLDERELAADNLSPPVVTWQ